MDAEAQIPLRIVAVATGEVEQKIITFVMKSTETLKVLVLLAPFPVFGEDLLVQYLLSDVQWSQTIQHCPLCTTRM